MQNTQFTIKISLILAIVSVSVAQPLSEFRSFEGVEIIEVSIPGVENTENARKNHHTAKYHVGESSFSKTSAEEVEQLHDALRRSYEINKKLTVQLGLFYRMNPIINGDMPMF